MLGLEFLGFEDDRAIECLQAEFCCNLNVKSATF
jgi:hypothetical protein